ncbi:MAG: penicillin-binding transpeptidase domain-containing protein [Myxococcota bacterium]
MTVACVALFAAWGAWSALSPVEEPAVRHWVSPQPVGASPGARAPARPAPVALLSHLPPDPEALERVETEPSPLTLPGPYFVESIAPPEGAGDLPGPLRVEYAFDADLTDRIIRVLDRARVRRGHVIVLDPDSGRVLAYVSTDPDAFPPDQNYPAASLVKIVTAAAALHRDPKAAERPCRYTGNPYRLRRSQIHPPRRGREVSLERALAMSNNHCFAQLAVHAVGGEALLGALRRFGWLEEPAPGHAPGMASVGDDEFDLGRLGCGLAGCRITPLHAAQLAATLADGERVEPWWIHRVIDGEGRELELPTPGPRRRVMTERLAGELRHMLIRTTTRGTARKAFRNRRGRPLLDDVQVAGKTGNLSGSHPKGRYEWFAGVAPADDPSVAVAVVQLHDDLWWQNSASLAAGVFQQIFCERNRCSAERARRYTGTVEREVTPLLLSGTATGS